LTLLGRGAYGNECAAPTCAVPFQSPVCNLYQHPGCYAPETPFQTPYQTPYQAPPVSQNPPVSAPPAATPVESHYHYIQQAYTVPEQVMMPMMMMVPQTVYRQRTFLQRVASAPLPAQSLAEPLALPVASAAPAAAPVAPAYAPASYAPAASAPASCSGGSRITEMLITHMLTNSLGGQGGARTASGLDAGATASLQERVSRLERRIDRLIDLMEERDKPR